MNTNLTLIFPIDEKDEHPEFLAPCQLDLLKEMRKHFGETID